MPKFTIERTFDVPTYRQETYEAPDLKTALEMDAQNDNWDEQKQDYDNCGDERVTGAWAGETAYEGENLHGSEVRHLYSIDFVYPGDDQSFATNALMNEQELADMGALLQEYKEEGLIADPNICGPDRVEQSFEDALSEIKNALGIEEEEAAVIRALIALDGAASDEAEVNHG